MKLRIASLMIAFCFFVSSFAISQKIDYGLILVYNKSSHTNYDPTLPEDGLFQWNYLGAFGFGTYVSRKIGTRSAVQVNLLYQQKGYKEYAQFGIIGGPPTPLYSLSFKNTFNYLSIDALAKYIILNGKTSELSLNAGGEYSYLLDYAIESDVDPFNSYYPTSVYQDQWKSNNLSLIISISLEVNKLITMEFGFNRSLTAVLETDNLIVKDWIWTLRTQISMARILEISKRKYDKSD